MSLNKKRKLNGLLENRPLSAFAARKTLQNQISKNTAELSENRNQEVPLALPSASQVQVLSLDKDFIPLNSAPAVPSSELEAGETTLEYFQDGTHSSSPSRAESPEILLEAPVTILSIFKPSEDNIQVLKDGTVRLKLASGERLVILGQCEISVQKGNITLLGSTLRPSASKYRIFAPSSHSIPVLRCLATDLDAAEISLHQCGTGLEHLGSLSPLFSRLWNDRSSLLGKGASKPTKSSFQILFSADDGPKGAYLQPILSAPEWNEALSRLSTSFSEQRFPRTLICGPKSSGKSTFAKLLSNRLLSAIVEKALPPTGVIVLDLDPGQGEYSVPGQLSLVHVQEPNFGPPFSHPIPGGRDRIIRAHSIAAVTPSMDPSLYMACALDLFAHYRNFVSTKSNCPLIINTPGWVLGTGLEILIDIINKLAPTDIVYMSEDGPMEVVKRLQDAANATPVITLPSQASRYATKTAAHLRTMQSLSYFHINPTDERLAWSAEPLSLVPPWEIRYSGELTGIIGVMCYGEQPPPDLLLDAINGSLLAVVVLEDMAAVPGWRAQEQEDIDDGQSSGDNLQYSIETKDPDLRVLDDESLRPQHLETPLIVRTPEDIPYFNPANAISLDPNYSNCIGLALVRGIDVARHRLQIITPISTSTIAEINDAGKSIVLVSGKFDTPGWAYTEVLLQKRSLEKAAKSRADDNLDSDEEDEEGDTDNNGQERFVIEGFQRAPWVEKQEGSQGRAIGSRVWRVRRDLGRLGD